MIALTDRSLKNECFLELFSGERSDQVSPEVIVLTRTFQRKDLRERFSVSGTCDNLSPLEENSSRSADRMNLFSHSFQQKNELGSHIVAKAYFRLTGAKKCEGDFI